MTHASRDERRSRKAFSLVEVLLALAIIAGLGAAILYSTVNAVSHSARAEDLLLEALIAQTVINGVRDANLENPTFFAHLEDRYGFLKLSPGRYQSFGAVTAAHRGKSSPFGPLEPSNLLGEIPLRATVAATGSGGQLLDSTEIMSGIDPLADFAVRVTISDQDQMLEFEGHRYYEGALPEMLKTVEVEVYHVSELGPTGGLWEPAYRLSLSLLAGTESLSDEASRQLDARFGTYDHRPALETIRSELRELAAFRDYEPRGLDLYALFLQILREVNVEYFRSEGRSLLKAPAPGEVARGLRQRIETLAPARSGYLKLERSGLLQEKLLLTFETFKRANAPLEDLEKEVAALDTEVVELKQQSDLLARRAGQVHGRLGKAKTPAELEAAIAELMILQRDVDQHLVANARLLGVCRLLEYILSRPYMEAAFARLARFPAIFDADLTLARDVLGKLSNDASASPLVRSLAARRWIAVSTAARVAWDQSAITPGDQGHLAALKQANRDRSMRLMDHLEQNQLPLALDALQRRNESFTRRQPRLDTMDREDGPVATVSLSYEPPGSQTRYLDSLGSVPGRLYRIAVKASRTARDLGLEPDQARRRLEPAFDGLAGVIENSLILGLTRRSAVTGKARVTQKIRVGRTRPPILRVPVPGTSVTPAGGGSPRGGGTAPVETEAVADPSAVPALDDRPRDTAEGLSRDASALGSGGGER